MSGKKQAEYFRPVYPVALPPLGDNYWHGTRIAIPSHTSLTLDSDHNAAINILRPGLHVCDISLDAPDLGRVLPPSDPNNNL
jgi:hypothetical protein